MDIAITGEYLVPYEISNIIDIKSGFLLDVSTMIEILIKLNCMDKYDIISSYFYRDIVNVSTKYIKNLGITRLKTY